MTVLAHVQLTNDKRRERKRAMAVTHKGRCFCEGVEIEVAGMPEEMGYCHCSSCRAYSGTPMNAFSLWKAENVKITRGAELLGRFQKTEMSVRHFCTRCGSHIMTGHPSLGLTDIYAFIIRGLAFEPSVHLNYSEAVLPMKDGLLKLADFPAKVGGTGHALPE
jgi:hypothetical protein